MAGFKSFQRRRLGQRLSIALSLALIASFVCPLPAQDRKPNKPTSKKISVTTKDGVLLSFVYFPAFFKKEKSGGEDPDARKSVAPLILVHDWDGRGSELYPVAQYLQTRKISVAVPDLRGHGASTRQVIGGVEKKIDRAKMRSSQINSAVLDIERVKKFLLEENNKKQVNIEMLTVMGTGFGSALALNWAVYDWNAPRLPTFKQGQDVKALILLSPRMTHRGASARTALKHPALRNTISVQVISGTRAKTHKDAERIYRALYRPREDKSTARVVLVELDTNLEGPRLLSSPLGKDVASHMTRFLNARIFKLAPQLPWTDRTPPFKQSD